MSATEILDGHIDPASLTTQRPDSRDRACPTCPSNILMAQGWKQRSNSDAWVKKNGEPVFFADIVNIHPPTERWVKEKMTGQVSIMDRIEMVSLDDFSMS